MQGVRREAEFKEVPEQIIITPVVEHFLESIEQLDEYDGK